MDTNRRKFLVITSAGITGTFTGCLGGSDNSNNSNTRNNSSNSNGKISKSGSKRKPTDDELVNDKNKFEKVNFTIEGFTRNLLPLRYELGELFHKEWVNNLGVTANMDIGQVGRIFDDWVNVDYDMLMAGWSGKPTRLDPDTFLSAFYSKGGLYSPNYHNPKYDEIVKKSKRATERKKRKEMVYKAQKIVAEDVPAVFLFVNKALAARNTQNWSNYTTQISDRNYTHVWNFKSMQGSGNGKTGIKADTLFPATLNPMGPTKSPDLLGLKFIYDRLIRIGPKGKPKPWAAKSWNRPDAKTVDVDLREGMTWHDGEPVTPEDVKFTVEYLKKWGVPYLKSYYDPIESVSISGSNSIRIKLKNASASFVGVGMAVLFIMPKHIWKGLPKQKGLKHPKKWSGINYIGSGPLKLEKFEQGNRIVWSVNKEHFADFNLDQFVWKAYGDKSVSMGDVEQGKASYIEAIQPSQYENEKNVNSVSTVATSQPGWNAAYMNNNRRPFDDKVFRKAMATVINKKRALEVVYNGRANSVSGPIAPSNEYWYNPNLPKYNYSGDIDKARSMLQKAGYRWDKGGNLLMPKK